MQKLGVLSVAELVWLAQKRASRPRSPAWPLRRQI